MTADPAEISELEAAADWRIRKLGADPNDRVSATAAALLQRLADDLRRHDASPAYQEYRAICGWLDEFDGIADFAEQAHAYRAAIGVSAFPSSGDDYLATLTALARATFGA